MSTATFNPSALNSAQSSPSRVWRHLLWKDWRQVWQLVIGITIVQAALQLMLGTLEVLLPVEMRELSKASVNIALAAPTLLAIACCGMLIGHERQTGCWAWSSSLPVSWRQSLLSKTVVWVFSSTVSLILLLITAQIALSMNERVWLPALFQNSSSTWTYVMTLAITVQVFIFFSIAALLIKDTLMAFVVAAVGMLALHIATIIALAYLLETFVSSHSRLEENIILFVGVYLLSSILGAIGLVYAYRWRWNVGQYAPVPLFGRTSSVGIVRPQRAAWQSFAGASTAPSEFRMLLNHGMRSALGLRIAVVVLALLLMALALMDRALPPCVFAIWLASCILGVSVFSGDQTANRFRFFADRGVDWKKLLIGHVLPPALIAVGLCAIAGVAILSVAETAADYFYPLLICIPIFIVGMLSSLVFASPIISLTVTFVVLSAMFAINSGAILIWEVIYPYNHWEAIAIWFPVSTAIILVVAIRLVPRWLRVDRLNAFITYFWTVFIAAFLPAVFGLTFGFLTIPNYPWQGIPLDRISNVDWSGGPEVKPRSVITRENSGLLRSQNRAGYLNESKLSLEIKETIEGDLLERSMSRSQWLASQNDLLEAIEQGGPKPQKDGLQLSANLSQMIKDSATVALMATDARDKDKSLRAWKANRKLIEFSQQPALQVTTMEAILFVWEMWNTLSDSDLKFLESTGELAQLTPPDPISLDEFRTILRARASIKRELVRLRSVNDVLNQMGRFGTYTPDGFNYLATWGFNAFPPLRWAIERQQSAKLGSELNSTATYANLSGEFAVGESSYSGYLTNAYFTQIFLKKRLDNRLQEVRNAEKQTAP